MPRLAEPYAETKEGTVSGALDGGFLSRRVYSLATVTAS